MDSKSQGIVSSCRRFGNNWTLWHFNISTPCLFVLQIFFFLPQSFLSTSFEFRGKPHNQLSWHFMKGRLLGQESENILQNQRTAEAERYLEVFWRSISLLKQGCLESFLQDHIQTDFWCLQGWRHQSPSVTITVTVLSYPQTKKKLSLTIIQYFVWQPALN